MCSTQKTVPTRKSVDILFWRHFSGILYAGMHCKGANGPSDFYSADLREMKKYTQKGLSTCVRELVKSVVCSGTSDIK
jgi:hypothetical protein